MNSYTLGRYTLEWVDLGEGFDGDYDPENPDDRPLLRADLYADGEAIEGASYCTQAPVTTPDYILSALAHGLLELLPADPAEYRRGVMERWTWSTAVLPDPAEERRSLDAAGDDLADYLRGCGIRARHNGVGMIACGDTEYTHPGCSHGEVRLLLDEEDGKLSARVAVVWYDTEGEPVADTLVAEGIPLDAHAKIAHALDRALSGVTPPSAWCWGA